MGQDKKSIPASIINAFKKHPEVFPSVQCECKKNKLKCEDASCRNREAGVECPEKCVKGCQNHRFRNGITDKLMLLRKEGKLGLGVKIGVSVCKGDIIAEYNGEHNTLQQYKREQESNKNRKLYSIESVNGFVIDASNEPCNVKYINESCSPNCSSACFIVDGIPRVLIIANRYIKAGEFLSYAYNMDALDGMILYECECNKIDCVNKVKHSKRLLINPRFECFKCKRKFGRARYMKQHMEKTHGSYSRFSCKICMRKRKKFNKRYQYETHLKSHQPFIPIQRIDTFIVQDKTIHTPQNLKTSHEKVAMLKSVTRSTLKKFNRHLCKRGFNRKHRLLYHLIEHDRTYSPFSCKNCSAYFFAQEELENHMKSHKRMGENFKCPTCEKIFDSTNGLKKHSKLHDQPKPSFKKCDCCDKEFPSMYALECHSKVFHPEYNLFKCSKCFRGFTTSVGLREHTKNYHSESRPKCQICKKSFYDKGSHNMHQKLLHASNKKLYRCHVEVGKHKICRRTFSYKGNLTAHVKSHKEIKVDLDANDD